MRSTFLMLTLTLLAVATQAQAQWGDFTAQFVFKGDAPKPAKLDVAKEPFCTKLPSPVVDESLLVDATSKGVANIVVSLLPLDKKLTPHESYTKTEKDKIECDNVKCRFEPHVVVLRTTQTLVIKNPDPMGHNAKLDLIENNAVNPLVPGNGGTAELNFGKVESLPMPMSCSIHPWMSGRIVIKDHPYVGVTDKDGKVTIKNLPAGEWTFQIWHERPGFVTKGAVGGKEVTWMKGRVKATIPSDGKAFDLGKVELTADQLKKKG